MTGWHRITTAGSPAYCRRSAAAVKGAPEAFAAGAGPASPALDRARGGAAESEGDTIGRGNQGGHCEPSPAPKTSDASRTLRNHSLNSGPALAAWLFFRAGRAIGLSFVRRARWSRQCARRATRTAPTPGCASLWRSARWASRRPRRGIRAKRFARRPQFPCPFERVICLTLRRRAPQRTGE
jgi:hypothetical protein